MNENLGLTVVLLFLLLIMEEAAEYFYKKTTIYSRSLKDVRKFKEGVPEGIEIANIGSGPGMYGITYENSKKKGFNFSTTPQSYKYGFRILDRYSDHLENGCIIIVIIMAPLSFGDNNDYRSKSYSDKYYSFLEPDQIDNYSPVRAFLLRRPLLFLPAKAVRRLYGAALSLNCRRKKKAVACKMSADNTAGKSRKIFTPDMFEIWEREFDLKNLTDAGQADAHRQAFAEKVRILEQGIAFCRSKSWRPVLVILPIPPMTRACISQEFLQAFVYDNLSLLMQRIPGLTLFDYLEDDRITESMFQNDVFLNQEGRRFFSDILLRDVNGLWEKTHREEVK